MANFHQVELAEGESWTFSNMVPIYNANGTRSIVPANGHITRIGVNETGTLLVYALGIITGLATGFCLMQLAKSNTESDISSFARDLEKIREKHMNNFEKTMSERR